MTLEQLEIRLSGALNAEATDRRERAFNKMMDVIKAARYHVEKGIVDPHDRLKKALEKLEKCMT